MMQEEETSVPEIDLNKIKPSALDWNQVVNKEDSINNFYLNDSDDAYVEEPSLTNQAFRQAGGLGTEIGTGILTDLGTKSLITPFALSATGGWSAAAYGVINFGSGYASNVAAQKIRGDKFSYGEAIAAGLFQMIPFGSTGKGIKGLAGAGLQGAVTAGGETTVRTAIDEQRLPTTGELGTATAFGTAFGTGFKGTLDYLSKKFAGKSVAEIDKIITKEDKNLIDKLLENTADDVYAIGPGFERLSDKAQKILEAIESGDVTKISKGEIIESIEEIAEKYPEKLTPEIKQAIGFKDKTTGRQKILPGTPHPTDAKKVRGYDGRWVTQKYFDQVTESRKGANKIRAQFDQPQDQTFEEWVKNPPEEYKALFKEIEETSKSADENIARSKQLFKEIQSGLDEQDRLLKEGSQYDQLSPTDQKKVDLEVSLRGDAPQKLDLTTDTRGKGEFYHGAADEFELDSSSHYSARGLYGQGLYTTDDLTTAGKYQKKNKARKPNLSTDYTWSKNPEADYQRDLAEFNKKPQKQTIYKITEKQPVKFFDLDQPVTQDIIEKLEEIQGTYEGYDEVIGRTFDEFKIGSYNKSTGKNPSLAQIIDEIRANNKANTYMSIDELDNITVDLEEFLRDQGFGGFTHQGGKKAGKGKRLHQVKIYWDPQDQLDINKVDVGGGGAVPPRKPPISQGDGPLAGTDTTPHQINPNQVTNAIDTKEIKHKQRQFNFIVKRIKQLKDEGAFSPVKTTADTIDGGIKMLADTNKLKSHAEMYAKIYGLVPTDELNYALAEAVTIATNKTTDINQKLIDAVNISKDPTLIEQNVNELIESIGEIDEWLRLGIPLRTEQGRGLRSMQIETQGVTPEQFDKMSAAEKYKLKNLRQSSLSIASEAQGLKLDSLKEKLLNALEEAKQTGNYSKINKLTNTIKRTNGSVEKLSALYETGLLHKTLSLWDKGNRIFNEIGINALLSAPTTNEINFLSGVIETYMSSYELIRGAGSRVELDAALRHLLALHSNASFARKAFTESFKNSDNWVNRGAVKADYQEKFVISSEGKDIISRAVINPGGKVIRFPSQLMTSVDALVQAPNLIASIHYQGHIEGAKLGYKGKDLDNYVKGHLDAILEYYASNSGKGIKDPITARILKRSQEFAKRSTFTEDIRDDGYFYFGKTAAAINQAANQIPAVRTLMSFVRAPTNIIKRQLRRTPVLNKGLRELANDLESTDPIVRNQARGQMKVAKELGITVAGLASAGILMQQNPDFIPPVIMTGGGPDWRTKEGRAVYKSILKNGWLPYSVGYLQKNEVGQPLIGDNGKPVYKYYSYERLDPLSSYIGLMVDFVEISPFLSVDEYDEFTTGLVGALTRNLFDRSYLQQVDESMKALYGDEQVRENFWSRQLASRFPYANFTRYAKQLPGDLLDMVGVSKKDSARFHQRRDTKVRKGDKLFDTFPVAGEEEILGARALRKLLNQYSATVPGMGGNLPFLREHITNEPILHPQRPGPDLVSWMKTSTSKNHPLWTALGQIGKELREPSDTFTGIGTSDQLEAFRLDTNQYAELRRIINGDGENGIKAPAFHPLYPNATLDEAMRTYLKTDHYKKNSAIVKKKGALNSEIAVDEIYSMLKQINTEFIEAGQIEWIKTQGKDKIDTQIRKKTKIRQEYQKDLESILLTD